MRDYGKVSTSLWRSRKFRGLQSDAARMFYLYLHTCPHVNSLGCFVLPTGYVEADLGWSKEAIGEAIDSLCEAGLIAFDEVEEVVRIIGFLEHDPATNAKHAAAIEKIGLGLPDCAEKLNALKDLASGRHQADNSRLNAEIDTLSHTLSIGSLPLTLSLTPIPLPEPSSLRSETTHGAGEDTSPPDEPIKRTRITADWQPPPADWDFAIARGLAPQEIENAAAEFRDYWAGVRGAKGQKADWPATWRNRVLDIASRRKRPAHGASAGRGGNRPGGTIAATRELLAELEERGGGGGEPDLGEDDWLAEGRQRLAGSG